MNTPESDRLPLQALAFLRDRGLSPTPMAYAVAYTVLVEPEGDLYHAVSRLIAAGALDEDACRALFKRYVDSSSADLVGETSEVLAVQLDESSRLLRNSTQATDWFSHSVSEIQTGIDEMTTPSKDQISAVLETLRTLTTEMGTTNKEIATALARTQVQVEGIRESYRKAIEEARTDALTELSNRKSFDEALARDVARCSRGGTTPLSLIVLDIDHFKAFNDSYGHAIGDGVIKHVASMLKESVRQGDVPARIGGEEFAIILANADTSVATTVAERIRLKISERSLVRRSNNETIGKVTVSAGVAMLGTGEIPASFLARADAALYEAKHGGRNRVCIASEPADVPRPEALATLSA